MNNRIWMSQHFCAADTSEHAFGVKRKQA